MRLNTVRLVVLLTLSIVATARTAPAQPAGKIPRLGVLVLGPPDRGLDPFHQGLQDLSYVEGKTIALMYRFAEGKAERLPALAAELVGLKVNLIVAYAFQAARATRWRRAASRARPISGGT